VLLELHQRVPMLDLRLFRNPTFAGANTVMLLVGLSMFGIFFFNSLFIQNILGYSAIQTGATFLPMTVLIILVAPWAGRFSDRIGPRWLMTAGMLLVTSSLLLFAQLDAGSTFWAILPGLLTGGFGMALAMTPTTAAAMGSVPVDKAGVGSAVINSMRQVGGSLGIAVMGAVVATQISVSVLNPRFPEQFVSGYHDALYVGAAITLGAAFIAASFIRQVRLQEPAVRQKPEPAVG
jgi:MFS family permease